MECLPAVFRSETAAFGDEFSDFNGCVNGDDLFVDQLLDFSNGLSETEEPEEKNYICSVSEEKQKLASENENGVLPGKDDFGSLPESELTVPAEGLESLEWLSNFVEDSFSDYSLTGKLPPKPAAMENRTIPVVTVHEPPCFTTPVKTKARTKRSRSSVCVWPVLSEYSATSSVSSTSSTTSFFPQNSEFVLFKPLAKKKKVPERCVPAQPRRCSHCSVTKTPQWRAGPLGSKTLCNACGVRYKSGRLLPEYRPACSPTYSMELHSNNHRKVLEMRRKRETETGASGLPPPVQSF